MEGIESPAIKALGPLFKLTEVHLWDYGSAEMRESSYFFQPIKINGADDGNEKSDVANLDGLGFCSLTENVELAELSDLGLPMSFQTNKEKRNATINRRRKGSTKKNQQCLKGIDDIMLHSIRTSDEKQSSDNSLNMFGILDQNDIQKSGIGADVDRSSNISVERWDSLSSTVSTSINSNIHDSNDEISDLGFYSSGSCDFGLSSISLGENEGTKYRNEPLTAFQVLVDGSFKGSCLLSEGIACDVKVSKGEKKAFNLEAPSIVGYDNKGQSNSVHAIEDLDSEFLAATYADIYKNAKKDVTGQWIACWDDFFMRSYFYNIKTEESTWDPPMGLEKLAFVTAEEATKEMFEMAELDSDQLDSRKSDEIELDSYLQYDPYLSIESRNDGGLCSEQYDDSAGRCLFTDCVSSISSTKRKKKVRRKKCDTALSDSYEDLQGVLREVTPSISKYWCQRYILFSRFDDGIKMDEEGWFSVTPECIARHHAIRCGQGAIIDFFTGVGGNAIQFAQRSNHVIAIDIDPNKIDFAQHNAALYGVEDKIDFIRGDSFALAPKLKANTVFMSPPWGGPDYTKVKKFDINTMLKPKDGLFLFNVGMRIASKIVMFLPRNVDINQLAELALAVTPSWSLEVEKNFLNDRLKAITAYFSEAHIP